MADPLDTLAPRVTAALVAAFGPEYAAVSPALRRSERADYQADVAMGLGKRLGSAPRAIAGKLAQALDLAGVGSVEVAGAGFLNITLEEDFLSHAVGDLAADPRLGVPLSADPETVILDYSSPQIAKEMHVGHLRSSILGDALGRVLDAVGHRVVRQNHLGDWGTPFGMLLQQIEETTDGRVSIPDINAFYQQARARFDSDEAFRERARTRVVYLQNGDPRTLDLWRGFVAESRLYLARVYAKLGLRLTDNDIAGESLYNPMLPDVVKDLEALGLVRTSDGAVCAFPPGFVGREGEPLPLIVRKQDGGYGYAATDLAAIRHRTTTLGGRRLVYVVGTPQSQHFAMVFKVAELAGWLRSPARAEHVAFGSVLGADKKMLKTRSGEAVRLEDLLEEAVTRARAVIAEKNPELGPEEREAVACAVGVGALKYADLSNDRVKDYVFDWSRMLAFEGNTGPYLQYAHARLRSIFRRAEQPAPSASSVRIVARSERALALSLLSFGSAVSEVAVTLEPHRLCTHLFSLASGLSTFYEECPVLKAATEEERASRLVLCDLTARVLARGLDLLGIEAPERM